MSELSPMNSSEPIPPAKPETYKFDWSKINVKFISESFDDVTKIVEDCAFNIFVLFAASIVRL